MVHGMTEHLRPDVLTGNEADRHRKPQRIEVLVDAWLASYRNNGTRRAYRQDREMPSPAVSWSVPLNCWATACGTGVASCMSVGYLRTLTARAITRARVASETMDWTSMVSFAHRESGMTSVGLNAAALVKER